MDGFTFIMLLVGAFYWGWSAREFAAKREVEQMFKQAEELAEEDDSSDLTDTIIAKVEKHGDNFYLFSEETDEFIAQGKDMQEIREKVLKRYRGQKNVAVRKDDSKGLL